MDERINKVMDRLRALCSRREYCTRDIMKKALDALDGDKAAAQEVVEKLVKDRYVDDLRYSSAFARDKSSIQGWGAVKIRYALSAKGIQSDVIAHALEEIDQERSTERLDKLLQAKVKALKDDPQRRLKLLRFALGRGYSYDEVDAALARIAINNDILT